MASADWNYVFEVPSLDTGADPAVQPPNTFSKLVGVDGSVRSKLRRMYGFKVMHDLDPDKDDIAADARRKYFSDSWGYGANPLTSDAPTKPNCVSPGYGAPDGTYEFSINGKKGVTFFRSFYLQKTVGSQGSFSGYVFLGVRSNGTTPTHETDGLYICYRDSEIVSIPTVPTPGVSYICPLVIAGVDGDHQGYVDFISLAEDHRQFWVSGRSSYLNGTNQQPVNLIVRYDDQDSMILSKPLNSPTAGAYSSTTVLTLSGNTGWLNWDVYSGSIETGMWNPVDIEYFDFEGLVPPSDGTSIGWHSIKFSGDAFGITDFDFLDRDNSYGVAYRIICPEQNAYGQLSNVLIASPSTSAHVAGETDWLGAYDYTYRIDLSRNPWSTNRYVEYFRSVSTAFSDSTRVGNLYLERRQEIDPGINGIVPVWGRGFKTGAAPSQPSTDIQGLSDYGLVLQEPLDPVETRVIPTAPLVKKIEEYEGLIMRATKGWTGTGNEDSDTIRWSPLIYDRGTLIPVDHRRRPSRLAVVQKMLKVGSYLVVVMTNEILRVQRSGTALSIDRLQNAYGSCGEEGAVAVNNLLFMVTPIGAAIADLTGGNMEVMGATKGVFAGPDRWKTSLDSVQAAYDASLGVIVFLNTTLREMLLIWLNEGVATEMVDVPFDAVTSGRDLSDLDNPIEVAAFLHGDTKKIYKFNTDDPDGTIALTMNGGDPDYQYNGTVTDQTGTNSVIVEVTAGTAAAVAPDMLRELKGFHVRFGTGTDGEDISLVTGESRRITNIAAVGDVDDKQIRITLANDIGSLVGKTTVGAKYHLAPVVFEVRPWPLSGSKNQPVLDQNRLKKVESMGGIFRNIVGSAPSAYQKATYQAYTEDMSTAVEEGEGTIDENSTNTAAAVEANGEIVVPAIKCMVSDLGFDLMGLKVRGHIQDTNADR